MLIPLVAALIVLYLYNSMHPILQLGSLIGIFVFIIVPTIVIFWKYNLFAFFYAINAHIFVSIFNLLMLPFQLAFGN